MELFVQYDQICTEDYHSGEQYGDWHTEYDFTVKGVTISDRSKWSGLGHSQEAFNVPFEAEIGDLVFVLAMTYSSGDSFGNASGMGEIIWVFKDKYAAEAAYKIWNESVTKDGAYSIVFKDDNGKDVTMSNPAYGYFEDCGSLDLHPFLLQP
jgi:hypothetical protein